MKNTLKNDFLSSRVRYIPLEHIVPNPHQPRRDFDPAALAELADSIRQYGVLQPATVRTRGRDYELVAGERRFRAAKLAGLKELPCLIAQVGEEDSALLALMENLQRRDLNYMEEAAAIAQLVQRWGLSQEEAARKLGKSQSAVANKLRLLRLPGTVVELLQQGDLSERHARALLRLADEEEQLAAAKTIIARGLNVAQTEEYIESLLRKIQVTPPHRRPTFILKDVRLFLNTEEGKEETVIHPTEHAWTGYKVTCEIRKPQEVTAGIRISSPPMYGMMRNFCLQTVKREGQ